MDLRTIARSLVVGACVLLGAAAATAQTDYAQHKATSALTLGAGYAGGA